MIRVGTVDITRVEEALLREDTGLFAEWNAEMTAEYPSLLGRDSYDSEADAFIVSIHSWLLRAGGKTIVIDTCGGNCKERPNSPRFHRLDLPYLDRLTAAGVAPEDVDYVICTHLHIDHVGWNTTLVDDRWVPTFPNATYVISRVENIECNPDTASAEVPQWLLDPYLDSVVPVIEAGQAKFVVGNEALLDGIDLMPTPGHSPGQMAVRVRSAGEEALFIGDVTHQPLQIHNPGWNSKYCQDAEGARQTRLEVLEYCAETNCLMLPAHFSRPHYGRVRRTGDSFAFVPGEAPA